MIIGQPVELLLQRRLVGLGPVEQVGDAADLGVHPGPGDDQLAATAGDRRVHERHAQPIARAATSSRSIVATSFRTGVLSPVSAASSISSVAATNSRPSAGTRLPASISTTSPGTSSAASISTDRAVAAHAGDVLQHLLERGEARLGLRFLAQAEHGVEDGEPEQHEGRARLAGHDLVHDRGAHEDDLHQVLVLAQEGVQRRLLRLAGEHVGAVPGLAFADLARGQPYRRCRRRATGRFRRRSCDTRRSEQMSRRSWSCCGQVATVATASTTTVRPASAIRSGQTKRRKVPYGTRAIASPPITTAEVGVTRLTSPDALW